jgi:hypothetical protein
MRYIAEHFEQKKDFPLTNDITLRVEFSTDKVARLAEEEVDFRVKVPLSLLKTISSEMYGRVSEKVTNLKLADVEPKSFRIFKNLIQMPVPEALTQLESLTLDETFKLLQFLSSYQVKLWMPAMVQLLNMQFSCSTPTVILPFFLT